MDLSTQEEELSLTTTGSSSTSEIVQVSLGQLPAQSEALESSEDWTGLTSSKERRKLQNRLNQRARRRRMKQEVFRQMSQLEGVINETIAEAESAGRLQNGTTGDEGYSLLPCPKRRSELMILAQEARRNYALGTPAPRQLSALVKLNLLTALWRNTQILGFNVHSICEDEFISPYNLQGPDLPCYSRQELSWPPYLRPTEAQKKITHHPFLDVFPFPSLREAGIRAEELGFFDEDDFCLDIFHLDDKKDGVERPRMIVWGESWDPRGWEVNVAFLRKWGWMVRGCPELLEGTNYWREKRGEKKLNFNLNP
ncbi:hypothetical protein HER10_EVM0006095 [Colletotrichum scovillei]|uniref:Aryl-alcohol dehydrogenase n=1 Tax=Colletotrichum scovillei TaxID=1209932 RepID=A0A9P7U7J9_9PEZI|nr:uncharacterized protein HER10_EVM0006095 [Colletotrichum scovillei]KAF4776418.1 hypothetical protein HER10_EVM0006095 [Colletotrichum scovillei]KAG7038210.1 Aryl-alcohol dehydrogenase [Colletotrichum scovillei]KAG7040554.1 Aryl-alcohol dehydrogenase [Colletotrichum scovillei]KAG7060601.1 Aryl-alcohol dehydrogenase [Colletotrichum scovillei]